MVAGLPTPATIAEPPQDQQLTESQATQIICSPNIHSLRTKGLPWPYEYEDNSVPMTGLYSAH